MEDRLLDIAELFELEGKIAEIEPLGEGFINDTFVVKTEGNAPDYILQRKNHVIFPDVPGMMENIKAVTEHIKAKVADPLRETLTVIPAKGWYSKEEKEVLMVVTRKTDLNLLLRYVKSIDPDAFLSVSSVMGVYGQGFDTIKVKTKK